MPDIVPQNPPYSISRVPLDLGTVDHWLALHWSCLVFRNQSLIEHGAFMLFELPHGNNRSFVWFRMMSFGKIFHFRRCIWRSEAYYEIDCASPVNKSQHVLYLSPYFLGCLIAGKWISTNICHFLKYRNDRAPMDGHCLYLYAMINASSPVLMGILNSHR